MGEDALQRIQVLYIFAVHAALAKPGTHLAFFSVSWGFGVAGGCRVVSVRVVGCSIARFEHPTRRRKTISTSTP
jgi:hypothetical protein